LPQATCRVTRPSATVTGGFVLGAIALLVAGILFFGSGKLFQRRVSVVSFFHGSVAGLQVGAPLTFRGVPVGEVKAIGIRFDPGTRDSIIQVNMELLPDKVAVYGPHPPSDKNLIPSLVQRGLTAQLVRESFVTGMLNVELDFRPGVRSLDEEDGTGTPEIPTVPSKIDSLTRKLEDIDIEPALRSLQRTLANVDAVLTTPELKQAIKDLPGVLASFRRAAQTIDREVAQLSTAGRDGIASSTTALQQALASVQTLATDLDRETTLTLGRANTMLDAANGVVDPNGRTMLQVQRAVDDLAATAARLRNLTERVDRDPSILIRGR